MHILVFSSFGQLVTRVWVCVPVCVCSAALHSPAEASWTHSPMWRDECDLLRPPDPGSPAAHVNTHCGCENTFFSFIIFLVYTSLIESLCCVSLQCCSLYLMNKVDFGSGVETDSDCGSHSSVHTWNTQITWSVRPHLLYIRKPCLMLFNTSCQISL